MPAGIFGDTYVAAILESAYVALVGSRILLDDIFFLFFTPTVD